MFGDGIVPHAHGLLDTARKAYVACILLCYHFVFTRRRMPRSPHSALDYVIYRHATIEICTRARTDVL